MPKVHITLTPGVIGSPDHLLAARQRIERVSGIQNINEKRLSRYGLVSGEVEADRIHLLESLPEVQSVSVDGLQKAL